MADQTAPPQAAKRIFTATLIIGVPGAGKTSLLDGFSTYLWETYRKVLLLYSWDGGAIPTLVQKRVKQGLIRFWRARTRSAEGLGLETAYLASKGYWPRTINPETGETTPAVEMIAPLTVRYALSCPKGHPLGVLTILTLIKPTFCSECKAMIAREQLQISETVGRTRGFEQVGGVAFDSLTSMTSMVMDHMDAARGAGQIGGEKPAFGGVVQSGSARWGGNNRADFGFGQSRGQQFVNNARSIPGLVEGPIFTALSAEASDEGGLSIVGAKLPGRAATDEASAWFGNVAEMGRVADEQGHQHFALYLRPFTDAQGRRHLLKTSATPTGLPDVLIDPLPAAGKPWSVANLGHVFRALDEDLRVTLADEDVQDAPGMAGAPSDYGEGTPAAVVEAAGSGIAPLALLPAAPQPAVAAPATPQVGLAPKRRRAVIATAPGAVPPVETTVVSTVQAAATQPPPTTGTTPPPPPGLRPPMKAPGS